MADRYECEVHPKGWLMLAGNLECQPGFYLRESSPCRIVMLRDSVDADGRLLGRLVYDRCGESFCEGGILQHQHYTVPCVNPACLALTPCSCDGGWKLRAESEPLLDADDIAHALGASDATAPNLVIDRTFVGKGRVVMLLVKPLNPTEEG